MEYDLNKIRVYINRCEWKWASTMKNIPHQYIVRNKCPLSEKEFVSFVMAQRGLGNHERWGKYNFPYLYIDGYKYWTMGSPIEETIIINRQKIFEEFNSLRWPLLEPYQRWESKEISRLVMKIFPNRDIFEFGFGNGNFIKESGIKPTKYYGVEPCDKAINAVRERMNGFKRRVSKLSFEEAINKWLKRNYVIIGLFGSPSFVMSEYLIELENSGADYFLMFYREGYMPEEYKSMHAFNYKRKELKGYLRRANVDKYKDYIIISTRKICVREEGIQSDRSLFEELQSVE